MRTACGDDVRVDERGQLVISAALPIEGLEASRYRKPVLVYDNTRWTLVSVDVKPLVYRFAPEAPNLYAPAGDVVHYDGERHIERREQRARLALAWLVWIPSVPLMPLIGLLPSSTKDKLVALGINPGSATAVSVMLEWLLVLACVIVYFACGGLFTPAGFVTGMVTLFLLSDVAYRVTSGAQGQTPGMFAVAREFGGLVRTLKDTAAGRDRLLDDDGKVIERLTERSDEPKTKTTTPP